MQIKSARAQSMLAVKLGARLDYNELVIYQYDKKYEI